MNIDLLEQRAALVATAQRFAEREIAPHVTAWDEAGEFPRALYGRAAALGLLGLGYPEELGGTPAPWLLRLALAQAMAHHGASGGVLAGLFSHNIGLPPILALGTPELQQRVISPVLRGEKIAALAVTEPGGGSDVARIRTTAVRDGDHYRITGEKVFITSGVRADFLSVAVRTGEAGARGLSMIVVPGDAPGLRRQPLAKMGWWCSDTAQIHFDDVRVPVANRVGDGLEAALELATHEVIHRVVDLGAVQRDRRDAVAELVADRLVGHPLSTPRRATAWPGRVRAWGVWGPFRGPQEDR